MRVDLGRFTDMPFPPSLYLRSLEYLQGPNEKRLAN